MYGRQRNSTEISLLNAGPASAHGIRVEINASEAISSTFPTDICTVAIDNLAVCEIDEMLAMAPQDIVIDTVAPQAGSQVSINVEQSQFQVDLDMSDNRASASFTSVGEQATMVAAPNTPEVVNETDASGEGMASVVTEVEDTQADTGLTVTSPEAETSSGGGGGTASLFLLLLMLTSRAIIRKH